MKSRTMPIVTGTKTALTMGAAALLVFLGTLGLAASAQAASSHKASGTAAPAVSTPFSLDLDCTGCHTDAAADAKNPKCLLSFHEAAGCTSCHNNKAALEKKHAKMDTKDPNKVKRLSAKNRVAAETCENCHKPEDLAKATEKSTALTDKNGTVVNPHDLPEGHFEENVTCTDCHVMHDDKADPAQAAAEACASCHHTDVYECYTCHA